MDNLSSSQRHSCMSKIRSKNTHPEMLVRRLLTDMGLRYRLYRRDLPGKPDIVISRLKIVFFINGCFWHCHDGCKKAVFPHTNVAFWKNKLHCNVERQNAQIDALRNAGWRVVVLWECQLKDKNEAEALIKENIDNERHS